MKVKIWIFCLSDAQLPVPLDSEVRRQVLLERRLHVEAPRAGGAVEAVDAGVHRLVALED